MIFTYMGESHGENNRDKLLFCFSLQGGCESPIFFSFVPFAQVGHIDKTIIFVYLLVQFAKWLWKSKEVLLFSFTWVCHMLENQKFCFAFQFYHLFDEFIVFFSCHFVLCSLITSSLCYGETIELHDQYKQKSSFTWRFFKKKLTVFFNRDQCQIMGYVNNFYVRSVSVCQEWVYLFWVMN